MTHGLKKHAWQSQARRSLYVSVAFKRRNPQLWCLLQRVMVRPGARWALLESKEEFVTAATRQLRRPGGAWPPVQGLFARAEKEGEVCMAFSVTCNHDSDTCVSLHTALFH